MDFIFDFLLGGLSEKYRLPFWRAIFIIVVLAVIGISYYRLKTA